MAKRKDRIDRFYEAQFLENRDWVYDVIYNMLKKYGLRLCRGSAKSQQSMLNFCTNLEFAYRKAMGFKDIKEDICGVWIESLGKYEKKKYSLVELLGGAMEKHKIDWMRVPVNTKLQIKGVGGQRWKNRYFAFCKDGIPYVFCGGTDSWSAESGWDSTFPITEFTECRFVDEEMEKKYWKD